MRLFTCCLIFLVCGLSSMGQPVKKGIQTKNDTSSISIQELLNPSFSPQKMNYSNLSSDKSKVIRFSKATKLLLKIGTDLVRGDLEENSIYSWEDAWKYPGPTIRYPETSSEYESFLNRYKRYNLIDEN